VFIQLDVADEAQAKAAVEEAPRRVADLINVGWVGGRQPTPMNAVYGLTPYFSEIETLTPEDIADVIAFMVTRPRRAAVFDLWFSPTEQI
jgi:NAD(P)-dependent dehydrogenase (short-subunit alcohol dehydrogenase family)